MHYLCSMSEDTYKTIVAPSEGIYTEKRSKFIAIALPVRTVEEVKAHLETYQKKYYDARHNCWCYLLGPNLVRYSDDGEPQGTAGQPMLNVFQRENVTGAVCVVTRYFGGILLGSGGLVRAYSKAASMALEAAGRARMAEWSLVETDCGYAQYERVRRLLSDLGAEEVEASFGAEVSVAALLPLETAPLFCDRLGDVTAGSAKSRVAGSVFRPQKIFSEK